MFFTLVEFSQIKSPPVAHDTDQKCAPTDAPLTAENHQLRNVKLHLITGAKPGTVTDLYGWNVAWERV
jgi:hypothetical protein